MALFILAFSEGFFIYRFVVWHTKVGEEVFWPHPISPNKSKHF